eukprot:10969564-Alexandrium_andersonii.AAC.1
MVSADFFHQPPSSKSHRALQGQGGGGRQSTALGPRHTCRAWPASMDLWTNGPDTYVLGTDEDYLLIITPEAEPVG